MARPRVPTEIPEKIFHLYGHANWRTRQQMVHPLAKSIFLNSWRASTKNCEPTKAGLRICVQIVLSIDLELCRCFYRLRCCPSITFRPPFEEGLWFISLSDCLAPQLYGDFKWAGYDRQREKDLSISRESTYLGCRLSSWPTRGLRLRALGTEIYKIRLTLS